MVPSESVMGGGGGRVDHLMGFGFINSALVLFLGSKQAPCMHDPGLIPLSTPH